MLHQSKVAFYAKMFNSVLNFISNLLNRSGGQLHLGENILEGFEGKIVVEEMITQVSLKCHKISYEMEIGTSELFCNTIKLNWTRLNAHLPNSPKAFNMKITSETNAYGALLNNNYAEGDFVDVYFPQGQGPNMVNFISLTQKINEYLPETSNCTEQSFYQCMADKVLNIIMQDQSSEKCIPPFYKSIVTLATNESEFGLCQEYKANKRIGEKITLRLQEAARLEECQRSCTQVDYYANVLESNSIEIFWPVEHDEEICYGFATTVIKVDEEYLIYGFADMVGSVGGSLGMFLGFSFMDQIFNLLEMIQGRIK